MFTNVIICLWKCSYAHSRLWSFIRLRICACTCMWICMRVYVDVHTYINIYASDYAYCVVSVFICYMSPCVCMVRDNWTVAGCSPMWTLRVHMAQTDKVIYSRTFTQGLNFTRCLFSVLLFTFYIFISAYGHFLLNDSEHIFICIYIFSHVCRLWFYCIDWFYDFLIGQNWPQ